MGNLAFHIKDVPAEKAAELAAALGKIGIDFEPERDLFFINQEAFLDGYFQGDLAEELAERMNQFPRENPARLKPVSEMSLGERYTLLAFAQMRMCWKNSYKMEIAEMDQTEFEEFQKEHPEMFTTWP